MARITETGDERPSAIDPESDIEWHSYVTLKIGPHPDMEEAHRKAIELDYGMKDGVAEIPCRVCLAYYLERHLGLDLDASKIPPERLQVVLLNRDEVEVAQHLAEQESARLNGQSEPS